MTMRVFIRNIAGGDSSMYYCKVYYIWRPRPPIRPCDERPPAMYGHFCLVPRVSVHDRYYCIVGWHRGHTWKSSTYEMCRVFLVLQSMLIQELRDATRETLSNFFRTVLKALLSPKKYGIVYAKCASPLLIIAFKQDAEVCEHLLFCIKAGSIL